jgi:hypothetical protein
LETPAAVRLAQEPGALLLRAHDALGLGRDAVEPERRHERDRDEQEEDEAAAGAT